jgi:hypothetical protein
MARRRGQSESAREEFREGIRCADRTSGAQPGIVCGVEVGVCGRDAVEDLLDRQAIAKKR